MRVYVDAARAPFRKYAVFSGRSSRREYWSFVLAVTVGLGGLLGLAFIAIGIAVVASDVTTIAVVFTVAAAVPLILYVLVIGAVFIPWVAVSVRRLHDANQTGFWLLIALFIPFCWLVVLYFLASASNPSANEYGPNPYGQGRADLVEEDGAATADEDDPPIVGWAAPAARKSESPADRTGLIVAGAFGAILIAVAVGSCTYVWAGGDPDAPFVLPWETAPGPIEFGSGGTECLLTDRATSFSSSAGFRVVAWLNRPLREGERTKVIVDGPNATQEIAERPHSALTTCIYNDLKPGDLPPGHYAIEFRAGLELLAYGVVDITP
jgi:uncharacterized membrane protein YhaH (DUF805 family)